MKRRREGESKCSYICETRHVVVIVVYIYLRRDRPEMVDIDVGLQ